MLRESSNLGAINVNLAEVTQAGGMSNDNDIEAAELLSQFAESLVHRDLDESARLRSEIISELGKEAFVDVASTAAAFHGFVRVADSTGIPHSTAAGGQESSKLQREIGIDQFYAAELRDRG